MRIVYHRNGHLSSHAFEYRACLFFLFCFVLLLFCKVHHNNTHLTDSTTLAILQIFDLIANLIINESYTQDDDSC